MRQSLLSGLHTSYSLSLPSTVPTMILLVPVMRCVPLLTPVESHHCFRSDSKCSGKWGGQGGHELTGPQFCHRDLPSLSSYRGIQQHFTVQCKLLHIHQSALNSLILQGISCLLSEMGEYYNVSFPAWQNMAALMLTLLSNGKRPLVTKHYFRNTSHSTILKATVHHPLDALALFCICCALLALLQKLASVSQCDCYFLLKFSLWVNWSTRNILCISWNPNPSPDLKHQPSVHLCLSSFITALSKNVNAFSPKTATVSPSNSPPGISQYYVSGMAM